jgi:hypothetical protein
VELSAACRDWQAWTDGALTCHVTGDASAATYATLVRASTGKPGRLGAVDVTGRRLVIDADSIEQGLPLIFVRAMAENLLGQAAGMDLHDGARGVLSRESISAEFTDADRSSCRDAGFCR